MKRTYVIIAVLLCNIMLFCSCESKREQEAIKICQESEFHWVEEGFLWNHEKTYTGLDFANIIVKQEPNKKYHWKARATDKKNVYIVRFVDEENWGYSWEVNIIEKTVVSINANEYMSRKYGLSRLDKDALFKITNVTSDTLKLSNGGVSYKIKGKVVNHTGKSISKADMEGSLTLYFENKTEKVKNSIFKNFDILKKNVSESRPWKDGETIDFTIITNEIKNIYLEYDPQYVFFTIEMSASDPIGYSYNKTIYEVDMKDRWNTFRNN